MVRYQWHTNDGCVGQVLPGNFTKDSTAPVYYVTAEIRPVGIALFIGERASQGHSKFLVELGTALGKQGYVVVRYVAKFDELRKQTEIQKTISACRASPYAQHVEKWVLIGVGSSSHISCSSARFFSGVLTAMIFAASPFTVKQVSDPEVSLKAPEIEADVPILFLHPSVAEACSAAEVLSRLHRSTSSHIKYMTIPDVDQNFKTSRGKNAAHLVSSFVVSAVLEFLNVLESNQLAECLIPSLDQLVESEPPPEEVHPVELNPAGPVQST